MTERKTKRKLSNIDFSGQDAHLALVTKEQGAANGAEYKLVLKSAKYTDEHLEKASKIKVTMEIVPFLQAYCNLYYEDAEVLARALGFDTVSTDEPVETYEEYIQSKVEAIEVIKQLEQSEDIDKTLADLDPEDYLALLRSQQTLEKAMKAIDKSKKDSSSAVKTVAEEGATTAVAIAKEVETKVAEAVPSGKQIKTEKSNMTKPVVIEQEVKTEVVEKSAYDALEKAVQAQTEQLTKALETVELYKKKEQEAILKARKEQLKATVVEDEKVEALFKALAGVEDELFQGAVKALEGLMTIQKNSELFKEQGASSATETKVEETPLMKAIKAAIPATKSN